MDRPRYGRYDELVEQAISQKEIQDELKDPQLRLDVSELRRRATEVSPQALDRIADQLMEFERLDSALYDATRRLTRSRRVRMFQVGVLAIAVTAMTVVVAFYPAVLLLIALPLLAFLFEPALATQMVPLLAFLSRPRDAEDHVNEAFRDLNAAEERLRAALQDEILSQLRLIINQKQGKLWSTQLEVMSTIGLGQLSDPQYEMTTKWVERLEFLMEQRGGGSYGVSGARGVGKTTLVTRICNAASQRQPPQLAVLVSAPVQYEPRDFLLYLYGEACRQILGGRPEAPVLLEDHLQHAPNLRAWVSLWMVFAGLILVLVSGALGFLGRRGIVAERNSAAAIEVSLAITGLVFIGLWLSWLVAWRRQAPHTRYRWNRKPPIVEGSLAFGLILFGAGIGDRVLTTYRIGRGTVTSVVTIAAVMGSALVISAALDTIIRKVSENTWPFESKRIGAHIGFEPHLIDRAWNQLRAIKFQQTFSSGWSGTLKVPLPQIAFAAEAATTKTTTLGRLPVTLPELVGELRDFLGEVADAKHRVIIAIDELDKIESERDAAQFLNDIKGVFGKPGCHFIVSISEDAMANFERRGMPFRDVFDSTFDEVTHLRPLDFDEARVLLWRRTIGLSEPFVQLCHCLSGGLARDLLRAARLVVEPGAPRLQHISDVCRRVMRTDLDAKNRAIMRAIAKVDAEPTVSLALKWCTQLELEELSADGLLMQCRRLSGVDIPTDASADARGAEVSALLRLIGSLSAYYYFTATVLQFFDGDADQQRFERTATQEPAGRLSSLAEARQAFMVSSALVWEQVSRFRDCNGMESLAYPLARIASEPADGSGHLWIPGGSTSFNSGAPL